MQRYVEDGVCGHMALWNPVDLGYSSTYILYRLLTDPDQTSIDAGRMGSIEVGAGGNAIMGEPFVFTAENIATYAEFF
jgi:rhamnose transport system substrate-binding protein